MPRGREGAQGLMRALWHMCVSSPLLPVRLPPAAPPGGVRSLSAMLINHYKMKPGVQSYHLGGMGCSSGTIAINLVRDMLKVKADACSYTAAMAMHSSPPGPCICTCNCCHGHGHGYAQPARPSRQSHQSPWLWLLTLPYCFCCRLHLPARIRPAGAPQQQLPVRVLRGRVRRLLPGQGQGHDAGKRHLQVITFLITAAGGRAGGRAGGQGRAGQRRAGQGTS